jgi:hypothetical protein
MSKPEPGSRLPDESAKAYEAFKIYRDQPRTKRSIDKVNQAATRPQGGRARASGQIRSYATQFHWVERVREWDEFLDQEERAERLEDAKAWRKTKRQVSGVAASRQIGGLRSVNFDGQKPGEWIRNWSATVAIRDAALGLDDVDQATAGGSASQADQAIPPDIAIDRFEVSPEMMASVMVIMDRHEHKYPDEPATEPDPPGVPPAGETPAPLDAAQAGDGPNDSRESFP